MEVLRVLALCALGYLVVVVAFVYCALAIGIRDPVDWPGVWSITFLFAPFGSLFACLFGWPTDRR